MADFDAQLPVRTIATEFTTEVANAAGTTINPAEDYAQGSTTSGQNGVMNFGAVTTAAPVYTTATSNMLSLDTSGNLRVTGTFTPSGLQNVNVVDWNTVALGSPSAYGTSPGAVNVIGVNAFITNTVPVTLTSTTITNTVAVAGTLTNNNAAPAANNMGVLPALAGAAAPTWIGGDQVLLSEDLAGNLRVITGTGSTTAVTGNVTVVQPTGTNLHAVIDSGTITVTQATGTNLHTVVDNFPADADALAQASTTSGQLGALVMGAVTTAAPTYTTATTNPLSIDTAGNLRTSTVITTPTSVLTYFTDAAVATAATVTHSLAGPIVLDAVHGAGSGEIKMTVSTGITASETDKWQGFTSAAYQNCEFALKNGLTIAAGSSVKVTIKNRDSVAQDVYLTIVSH